MEIKYCDICNGPIEIERDFKGKPFWNGGHNAQPIVDGRCCDGCLQRNVVAMYFSKLK